MSFSELAESRRCIRSYIKKEISEEILIKLLEAGRYAPSAGNCQPWHFYVIKDKTIRDEIGTKVYPAKWVMEAPVLIVVCAIPNESEQRYSSRGKDLYCIQDTAAAIQNILLCAEDNGLGACWIGEFSENELSVVLQLDDNVRPVAIIPVGYTENKPLKVKRKPLSEIVTILGDNENSADLNSIDNDYMRSFMHCDMSGILFEDVNLGDSTFTNINMSNIHISDVNLSESTIHLSNLSNMKITDSLIDGLSINGIDINELLKKS